MSNATEAYAEYVKAILRLEKTAPMLPIPDEALKEHDHEPLFLVYFAGDGPPVAKTISVAHSDDTDVPSLVVRREITFCGDQQWLPIGLLPGGTIDEAGDVTPIVRSFFMSNGLGDRPTSTAFLETPPIAARATAFVEDGTAALGECIMNAACAAELPLANGAWTPPPNEVYGWHVQSGNPEFAAWWESITARAVVREASDALLNACYGLPGWRSRRPGPEWPLNHADWIEMFHYLAWRDPDPARQDDWERISAELDEMFAGLG
jgi:hypothetical protein